MGSEGPLELTATASLRRHPGPRVASSARDPHGRWGTAGSNHTHSYPTRKQKDMGFQTGAGGLGEVQDPIPLTRSISALCREQGTGLFLERGLGAHWEMGRGEEGLQGPGPEGLRQEGPQLYHFFTLHNPQNSTATFLEGWSGNQGGKGGERREASKAPSLRSREPP